LAFRELDFQAVFFETAENDLEVVKMLFRALAINDNVIDVYERIPTEYVGEHQVHNPLKNARAIFQSHRKPDEFVMTIWRAERGFVLVSGIDHEVIETVEQV
jgi:hypothetical protein